jgi:hypothetical protein
MSAAARRPGFWCALALAVVLGVGTIWLLASTVEASWASGAIVLQCGDALAPKTGADVDLQVFGLNGEASIAHPCDKPVRNRRVLAALAGVWVIGSLVWLGFEIRRAENDVPATT